MINYGRILKQKEKDNPSPFCRASYLISNVGDMVKCYGRMIRFPTDAHIYQKEMELAIGDVIMQCRLIQAENGIKENQPHSFTLNNTKENIALSMYYTTYILDILNRPELPNIKTRKLETTTGTHNIETITSCLLDALFDMCDTLHVDFEEIQHLGFIHTIERFEQFEKEGWK